jgi:flagellar biosynthesis protein
MTSYISGSKAGAYTKHAAALRYDPQHHSAPTVVAKGENVLAEEIIALAREHGVLIHEDPHLAEVLNSLEIGQSVPQEIFIVVAELIAFSYVLQGKFPKNWHDHQPINTEA